MNYSIPLKYYIVISIIAMTIESFLCIFYGKYYFSGWHNAEIEDIIFHVIVTISLIYYYKKKILETINLQILFLCTKIKNRKIQK